ncbi:CD209 antigen-like protein A [Argopecten irradians]|uniref:CD209 antigen-like protein A n=1 Tax=Argopecten irradians TaxID=31199 RepID=UPI00371DCFE1
MSTSSLSVCTARCSDIPRCYGVSLHVVNKDCQGYSRFSDPTTVTGTRVWKKDIRCHPHYTYIQASDTCFKWYGGSWDDGNTRCEEEDGGLIVLNTATKLNSVRQSLLDAGDQGYYLIGGRYTLGTWAWLDETPVDMSLWGPGEPSGTGWCMAWQLSKLDDTSCSNRQRYICEKP